MAKYTGHNSKLLMCIVAYFKTPHLHELSGIRKWLSEAFMALQATVSIMLIHISMKG